MTDGQFHKHREIFFAEFPPNQVPDAAEQLRSLEEVTVELVQKKRAIGVDYDLTEHTLQELEDHLTECGYHLENNLLNKLVRALIHYVEETQLHNLEALQKPQEHAKQEAYVTEWEHHPHGDHDDTPQEWREYK